MPAAETDKQLLSAHASYVSRLSTGTCHVYLATRALHPLHDRM